MEKFKKRLEAERTELEKRIESLDATPDFGEEADFDAIESDESEAIGNQLAVKQDLKERFEDIELALRKIERGDYGVCESCQGAISEELLEVNPESRLCQDCKMQARQ